MTKLTTTIRSIAVVATLMIASVGSSVQAGELSSQAKQQLFDALGQAFSNQVAVVVAEVNYDIERSISQSLINLGQPTQPSNAKVTVTVLPKKKTDDSASK